MSKSVIPPESIFTQAAAAWNAAGDDTDTSVGDQKVGSMKTSKERVEAAEVAQTSEIWGPAGYLTDVKIMQTYQTYRSQLLALSEAAAKEMGDTADVIREISRHYVETEQINTEIAGRPL